jgi:zinc D-Ala-D-Ala carboxypeptidase
MNKNRVHIVVIATVSAVAIALLSFAPSRSSGQSRRSRGKSSVKPTVMLKNPAATSKANTSPELVAAAERNAILRNELNWTFGGKPQRGWYLYNLLIAQTLKTDDDPGSSDFAAALGVWQRNAGLSPSGVLDEESLLAMVTQWQNNRLKNRDLAVPDQLLTAPSSDFYDPEREEELRQVERNTYAAYKRMVTAALADPTLKLARTAAGELAPAEKYFKIISAFRTPEYQERLRRESPNAGSAGLAVNSPHFSGKALDIYVGGDPVDTRDFNRALQVNTPAYKWLVRNAERFGFRPYFYEPWHWEYLR